MHEATLALSPPIALGEEQSYLPIIGWSFVLIALCVTGWLLLVRVRKWMKEDPGGGGIGFTLGDLRALHRRGEITDEQFEKAKAKIVQGTQAAAEKIAPAANAPKGSVEEIRARAAARRAASDKPST